MRHSWVIAIAAAAMLMGAGIIPAKTRTVAFKAATMKSTSTVSGSCWTGSIASQRPDAYRCSVGNAIHDPCFSVNAKSVACPDDPVKNTGVRIALTKALPQPNPGSGHNAWMMQLSGGTGCNVGTGTIVPGYPFYCEGNLVCTAPPASPKQAAVFVSCGHPESGTLVTGLGKYLVTTMYE